MTRQILPPNLTESGQAGGSKSFSSHADKPHVPKSNANTVFFVLKNKNNQLEKGELCADESLWTSAPMIIVLQNSRAWGKGSCLSSLLATLGRGNCPMVRGKKFFGSATIVAKFLL
ncbi:MAG: hypothetical protein WCG81_16765 [Candidatus Angelobacter sp.]